MQKWEYAHLKLDYDNKKFDEELNRWGAAGWEMIQLYVRTFGASGSSSYCDIFFKRPKP